MGALLVAALGAWQVYGPVTLSYVGTPSIPEGLYLAHRTPGALAPGDFVCLPGDALPSWVRQREYLPDGMQLCKQVAATAGGWAVRNGTTQTACSAQGECVTSILREVDSHGRALPPGLPEGRTPVLPGQVYLYSAHPRGLDSRYLGMVMQGTVSLRLTPVLTNSRG